MQRKPWAFLMIFFAVILSNSASATEVPRLEMDLTTEQYENLFEKFLENHPKVLKRDDGLDKLVENGKRAIEWMRYINEHRAEDRQLLLSKPGELNGFPITDPKITNIAGMTSKHKSRLESLPTEMREVILNQGSFDQSLSISDVEFLSHMRGLNSSYQDAVRWIMMEPYRYYYIDQAKTDLRGYYHLNQTSNLEKTLKDWSRLSAKDKEVFQDWLLQECLVTGESRHLCFAEWRNSLTRDGHPYSLHLKYIGQAKKAFDGYFSLEAPRSDVTWDVEKNLMNVVFLRPEIENIANWLKHNIEDEYRFLGWALKINFSDSQSYGMSRLEFEEGVTPHVERVGGNVITMDANMDLSDFKTMRTIRHEYGHILGFPDCYLEFFDTETDSMINYQLDLNNFMCSGRGRFLELHFSELKKAYKR